MALRRKGGRERTIDYWPGFVDALSTLLLAIMFLLVVFVLGQFILSQEVSGRDEVLERLNNQINELTELLALEKGGKQDLEDSFANLQAQLTTAESERSRLQKLLEQGAGTSDAATARIGTLNEELAVGPFRGWEIRGGIVAPVVRLLHGEQRLSAVFATSLAKTF